MAETSTKPYFLRALHEWATDNGYTPHIVVQVDALTRVPVEFVRDGQITLNVSYDATNKLVIGNDFVEFQARFSGKTQSIQIPVGAVSAIYVRETGAGMGFEVQATLPSGQIQDGDESGDTQEPKSNGEPVDKTKRPNLKIVK